MGDYADQGGDAIRLLDWLAERETFYPVEIHTANPVGRANMERILASTGRKFCDNLTNG